MGQSFTCGVSGCQILIAEVGCRQGSVARATVYGAPGTPLQRRRMAVKNYSKPEIVEVGPAEELVLGGGFMPELDMPIDTQWFRADASIADAD